MSIQAPSYKTFGFIPSSLEAQVAERKITAIYATAYPGKPVDAATGDKSPKTNHWVFFCAINEQQSVRIDPTPSGPNQSLVCAVSLKEYIHTNEAVKIERLVTKDLTIKAFIDLIKVKKYDKYQFTNGGQGCRYWVYTIINMLKSEGHLSNDTEFHDAIDAIKKTWKGKGDPPLTGEEATPIVKGSFFAL